MKQNQALSGAIKRRFVKPMTRSELEALDTGSLLSRLERLRSLEEKPELSDWDPEEVALAGGLIAFKNADAYGEALADVKQVLGKRENVERGSKEKRQQVAFRKKHR